AYEEARKQQGSQGFGDGFGGQRTYSGGGQGFDESQFSDFFESMFGGGGFSRGGGNRRQTAQFKGQDLNATLRLNLTDILESQKQTISIGEKKIRITIPAGAEDGQTREINGLRGGGMDGGSQRHP